MTITPLVVLVTGASAGIGAATSSRLAAAGHTVIGAARRVDPIPDDVALKLAFDVTDGSSVERGVAQVLERFGRIDVLVNNAGYAELGAVEEVSIDAWRRQFDTNLFGLVHVTQQVLPGMRTRRSGRIVNVSSVGGRTVTPAAGVYQASKWSVEAMSDALRMETRSFGIDVVVVEPGGVVTEFAATADAHTAPALADGPYDPITHGLRRQLQRVDRGGRGVLTADQVARTIERAATTRRPRTRYLVGGVARTMVALHAVLPDRGWDALNLRMLGTGSVPS
jgi:NADP-dependent 3-hydroxy acid dehydrogenase YdfG